ncbi:MAG: M48 family metalloprotease [Chthonomonas sp.]|nr:M48 family metalloprotease [Chthonomonas sp.]
MKTKIPILALVLASAAVSATADPFKISAKEQAELGQRAAGEVRKTEKVLPATDPRSMYVSFVGEKLRALYLQDDSKEKNPKPFTYTFEVVESKEVNAFALPGGPTFIYTGLLEKLTTEDELAGVMAHELTHAREEHFASDYAAAQRRGIGLAALLTILNANQQVVNVASITNDVVFGSKFSRRSENRADEGGYKLMVRAGYNPEGMVKLFELLAKQGGSKPPEWMSTHPSDKNRITNIQKWIDRDKKKGVKFPELTKFDVKRGSRERLSDR